MHLLSQVRSTYLSIYPYFIIRCVFFIIIHICLFNLYFIDGKFDEKGIYVCACVEQRQV